MVERDKDVPEPGRSALLIALLGKRADAIAARTGSGIEQEWIEDEEYYQGVDDANRAYVATAESSAKRWATSDGRKAEATGRSVVFLNITAPYVDSASASIAEKLLPTDDRAWAIKPTPITTQMRAAYAQSGVSEDSLAQMMDAAKIASQGMQDEIEDHLNESNWHGEVRQVIEDAARIGSGVLKGPFPKKQVSRLWRKEPDTGEMLMLSASEIVPATKRIDPWHFWPDAACGESVQNGSYTWELEYLSSRQLADLIGMPGYDSEAIKQALVEGPSATASPAGYPQTTANRKRGEQQFEVWVFYGTVSARDLIEYGVAGDDAAPKQSAMALILNDRIIKVALNVLDSGDLPYDVLAWQRRPGMPWGTGVSRKIRTVQRILNGSVRAMLENAGLSAGVQIVIGNGIVPADNDYTISGRKIWRAEADVVDVRQSFHAFVPPSVQGQLMGIVTWAMKVAEDTTGMPAMLQGIRGDAPDTLGGMQMAQNNSSSVLRRIAKRMDDYVTKPHITRYFQWLMQYSDRDDIKGDFQVDVRASSALVERDAQQQFLLGLMQLSADPKYEISPARLASELLKGKSIDPKRVLYTQQELDAMQKAAPDPVAEAKAALLQAQKRLAEVTAVNKSVEGMYSATTAATQLAANPAIAVPADELMKSAGFVDANAPPIVPGVNLGEPVQEHPIHQNTSPMFPPNPDVGINRGMESGDLT
jgi:hypothetical protein